MVTHIVMWNFADHLSEEEKAEAAKNMKERLEPLKDVIEGTLSLKVITNPLPTSSYEVALVGEYVDEAALSFYATHPEHLKVVEYIKTVCKDRAALDY